jgi:hypothetical protein
LVVGLLIAGAWLVSRRAAPAAESPARQDAVLQAAPGGRAQLDPNAAPLPEMSMVEPTTVDLRTIPAGVYDPNNQYDRWQRGEIDLTENESIVSEARAAELRAEALRLPPSANIDDAAAVTANGPISGAPTVGVSFDSIYYNECCGGGGNVPPDPELAVGPNHVIAVVNVAFEIYDKSGTSLVGPTTFSSFMAGNADCTGVFDPNAIYDESADRYILGIDADGTHYCIAVSQTGDPTGNWNLYAFQTGTGNEFFDYPHAGVGRDAIYMGANIFTSSFLESRVYAFDKVAMYNGQAAASVVKDLPTTEDTPQPLHLHGWAQGTWPTSGPHYFFTETDYNGSEYSVWSWANPFSGTSPAKVGNTLNISDFTGVSVGLPQNVPQSGGSAVQGNDYRPQDFEYRDGYAWSVSTVSCNPGSGLVNCLQWVKVNPATATIVDAGVYGSNGQYRFFGDLAVNACGDMALGYSKSSTSMWPSVWYTGRKATDAAGTLQAEAELKAGEIAYTAFDSVPRRWGDYTEMTIDPAGTTFWYLGEYSRSVGTSSSGRWGTWIGSFSYADCNPAGPTATPTNTPGPSPTPTDTPQPTFTPTPTNTPPPTFTPTPTNTPAPNVAHISDLDGSKLYTATNRWRAIVTIKVVNGSNQPVSGATVSGVWSNGATGSGSCTTNTSGTCSINKNNIRRATLSVRYTVNNVTKSGWTYNAALNSDPDGDSNGTFITITRP